MNKFIKERNHILRTMARIERKYNADLFTARIKKTMRRSFILSTKIKIIAHLRKNDSFLIYHTMREAFLSNGYKAEYYMVTFDYEMYGYQPYIHHLPQATAYWHASINNIEPLPWEDTRDPWGERCR